MGAHGNYWFPYYSMIPMMSYPLLVFAAYKGQICNIGMV